MFAKKLLGPAVGVALAFGSASALGAAPAVTAFVNGPNNLSDDSGETLTVLANDVGGAADMIGVGSVYVGMIGITSFPTSGTPVGSVNELTGIFALEVKTIILSSACSNFGINGGGAALCNSVSYGPVADFNAAVAAVGLGPFTKIDGVTPLDLNSTVALIFEDPLQNFDRDGGAFGTAADGTHVMTITGVDGGITGVAPESLTDVALFAAGDGVGNFTGNLTVQEEGFVGAIIGPTFKISTGGQSAPTAGSAFVGNGVHNDATFLIDVTLVPEPGILGLMGLGLLGLGAAGSRRRRLSVA